MIKALLKLFVVYVSYLLMKLGYALYIGEAKYWWSHMAAGDDYGSQFERTLGAIPAFTVGLFLLFLVIKSVYIQQTNKVAKLIKRGRYCWRESNGKDPYCCKCYDEQNRLSKLISIDGKYYCPKCDHATIYFASRGISDESIDAFFKAGEKDTESKDLI